MLSFCGKSKTESVPTRRQPPKLSSDTLKKFAAGELLNKLDVPAFINRWSNLIKSSLSRAKLPYRAFLDVLAPGAARPLQIAGPSLFKVCWQTLRGINFGRQQRRVGTGREDHGVAA